MLLEDFYTITKGNVSSGVIHASLSINGNHAILKGHFPGHPVVPGVCMMQIIKELAEHYLKKDLRLTAADNIKFLSVLNPLQTSEVEASVSYTYSGVAHVLSVNASLFSGETTFFKLKATLQAVE